MTTLLIGAILVLLSQGLTFKCTVPRALLLD